MEIKHVFEKIDALRERYFSVWEHACSIDSPTDYKEGVDAVGAYFASLGREMGLDIEIFENEKSGNVVCMTLNHDSDAAPVIFSAHMDTVHPIGLFGVSRDAEKIYGPGTNDCKGGAVAGLLAIDALKEIGFTARPVMLMLQSDEEGNSIQSDKATIKWMCERARGAAAFLNCELREEGCVIIERKGVLRYRLHVTGAAAHSAYCMNGKNAIAAAAAKILELEKLKDFTGVTCNCGIISGGTKPNVVCEKCSFVADIRFATKAQRDEVDAFVRRIADEPHFGCTCEVEKMSERPSMERVERNVELYNRANEIWASCGLGTIPEKPGVYGSDAAEITVSGVPCIDSIGVVGDFFHSVNEFAYLDSLPDCAKRLAAIAACL